jgi:hypothetical protein
MFPQSRSRVPDGDVRLKPSTKVLLITHSSALVPCEARRAAPKPARGGAVPAQPRECDRFMTEPRRGDGMYEG